MFVRTTTFDLIIKDRLKEIQNFICRKPLLSQLSTIHSLANSNVSEATLAAARHFWITVKAESFQLKKSRKNHAILCDKQSKFKKEISLARTNSKTTFFPSAGNLLETLTTQKACLLVMLIISIVIVCVNFFLR